jgi:hypothetical protein
MRAGVTQGGLISPVLCSLYFDDMPTPWHHAELAFYVPHHSHILQAAARQLPGVIISDLQRWLSEWRMANNLSNSSVSWTALHSTLISNTFQGANPMSRHNSLCGSDHRQMTRLIASHRSGEEENFKRWGWGSPPEQEYYHHQERSPAIQAFHPLRDGLCVPRLEVRCPLPRPEASGLYNPSVFASLPVPLGTLFTDHIRALTVSFDSKLAEVAKPLFRQLGRYLRCLRVDFIPRCEST